MRFFAVLIIENVQKVYFCLCLTLFVLFCQKNDELWCIEFDSEILIVTLVQAVQSQFYSSFQQAKYKKNGSIEHFLKVRHISFCLLKTVVSCAKTVFCTAYYNLEKPVTQQIFFLFLEIKLKCPKSCNLCVEHLNISKVT